MNSFKGELEVTLEGKTYKVLMTMNALRLVCQQHDIRIDELEQFMEKDPLTAMCALTYHGAKNASLRKKQELPHFDLWCAMCLDDITTFDKLSKEVMETLAPDDSAVKEGND